LSEWATLFSISQAAATELLRILWQAGMDVAKYSRTLLQTPNDNSQLKTIFGGNYYHFGVKNGIEASLKRNNHQIESTKTCISLNINIDGLVL
jgi:hypothetical protein